MARIVLVAGATGVLGREVVAALSRRGLGIRVLTRNGSLRASVDQRIADLEKPDTLRGICSGVDAVISCAGASMQLTASAPKATYYEVDHLGNAALLKEAVSAGVSKFVYVSLACGRELRHTAYADAHERFVDELRKAPIETTVVRPTGFFSFYREILNMAKRGNGVVVGPGTAQTNPVHQADVALASVSALDSAKSDIEIGGPDTWSRREVVELAFKCAGRHPRIMHMSPGFMRAAIAPVRWFRPRLHALMHFGVEVSLRDVLASTNGTRRLEDYFRECMTR